MAMRLDWLKNRRKAWWTTVTLLALVTVSWLLYAKGPFGPPKIAVAKVQK